MGEVSPLRVAPLAGPGIVLAADGGGTKTDVVAVLSAGTVLSAVRGGPCRPGVDGDRRAVEILDELFTVALRRAHTALSELAPSPPARSRPAQFERAGIFLAGFDLAPESATFRATAAGRWWAQGPGGPALVDNDSFALLRAGSDAPNAVVIICGTGSNCAGRSADGRMYRIPALGRFSGDWGGGGDIGESAMYAISRAQDGRGPATLLQDTVPAALGMATLDDIIAGIHFGRLHHDVFAQLAPTVFAASDEGDPVARAIVTRQATEVVTQARAATAHLRLADAADVDIVLGGGVLAARNATLTALITDGLKVALPRARVVFVEHRPVVGAAALTLESVRPSSCDVVDLARQLDSLDSSSGTSPPAVTGNRL